MLTTKIENTYKQCLILDSSTASEIDSSVTVNPITNAVSPNRRKSRPSSTEVKEQDLISNGGGTNTNKPNFKDPSEQVFAVKKTAPPPPPPRSSSTKGNPSEQPENNEIINTPPSLISSETDSGIEVSSSSSDLNR